MGIHSKILVHWTGKDIEISPETNKSQLYVERLKSDCENGLFAKRTPENAIRGRKIKNLLRICFTEIRLSQAQTHAKQYGKLGIGFERDFIMDKGGRPVIYIPYKPKNGGRLLEDSIKNAYNNTKNEEVRRSLKWIFAHVKRMSENKNGKDDCYEEMEWRLVYDESRNNKHFVKGERKGIRRLKFEAEDIKVIIFPDDETKKMALEDEVIRKYFSKHIPMIATLDDCGNF